MKPVETTPLEGRVKVDISLHKSVTPVTIYVFINFPCRIFILLVITEGV
jgi:hypothetical protein